MPWGRQIVWDDSEEQRYRLWLRELDQSRAEVEGKLMIIKNSG